MGEALRLEGVRISLDGRLLVELDRAISAGEVLTVMGPSGSGKSTLLAYVAGFLDPAFRAEGRVLLNGTELTGLSPEERRVGLLFQDPLLFPHLSVAGNLLFGVRRSQERRRERAVEALASAGLAGFGERDPATLSGGQQARVALLRVLLSGPRALLLDEPFSKLDQDLRGEIRRFVFARAREEGLPTLLVTHDPADAEAAGGEVVMLGR
jgi:putative thiamine transport system ATP-binding protein